MAELAGAAAAAPAAPVRSKDEQIQDALAGKIRKRDEESAGFKSGVVPEKQLGET